jgi:hypothetical protein
VNSPDLRSTVTGRNARLANSGQVAARRAGRDTVSGSARQSRTVRRSATWLLAGAIVGALASAPITAAAQGGTPGRASETDAAEVCGVVWNRTHEGSSIIQSRPTPGSGVAQLFFREQYVDTYRDPEDAAQGFIEAASFLYQDILVTSLGGSLYRFDAVGAGTTAIKTLDGRVVARTRGSDSWWFLVDTHDSADPDDYELLDSGSNRSSGPHDLVEDAYCDFVAMAIARCTDP